MKQCFKCRKTLPLEEFYQHKMMADGHLGKCKECAKRDEKKRRKSHPERFSMYERIRFQRPERKRQILETQRRRRAKFPEKARAYGAVRYAVKSGKLVRGPCEICGKTQVQAHHKDYSRPLDVQWLCFKHHREHGHAQIVVCA
jgi:hypothetical protein